MKRIQLFQEVPFDKITTEILIQQILHFIKNSQKKLVLNMNTYGVVTFMLDDKYASIIKSADLIYPDGWGPVLASKVFGQNLPERVNVGDFIDDLLVGLNAIKGGLYLVGCENETLKKTVDVINKKYPKVKLSGYYTGFFSKREEPKVVEQVKNSHPNLVLVGMGIPDQEYFLDRNWSALPPAVYMGVGGVFYYISGLKSRAPLFMRKWGLEWLYRLMQEPRRLWWRYTIGNFLFVYYVGRAILKSRSRDESN